MSINTKIGVVVQGPLVSRGRTGATANIGIQELKEKDIVDFDCINNISNMYSKYKDDFDNFICVTWDTEDVTKLVTKIGKEAILSISDTTKIIKQNKKTIISDNTKYKQFFSTLKGMEYLQKKGCTYAIKIRTDQSLDLSKMKFHLLKVLDKVENDKRFIFPLINLNSPDLLEDFYFGAKTENIINLCKIFLEKPEIYHSVHSDLFYKCAWLLNNKDKWPPDISYTPSGKYSKDQRLVILSTWSKYLDTFTNEIFQNLVWRGEKFPKKLLKNYIFNDVYPNEFSDLISNSLKKQSYNKIFNKAKKFYYKLVEIIPFSLKEFLKRLINRAI
mgnify:CR=1 FL=1